eukprot:CAMPEP_0181305238 /NCGR_PEP_ID=MMETSP1101-20121128/9612_1 /TAXON_ID=46948 /ORGANISM="Rhodomonas abbreviata, Strain Caron Lab Isolate" /LENGTH=1030 /DNA_ID=CAMNT_0023411119 /DNA_START=762 /DNA_END=3857 /DNA_ORIENTATION=-
MIREILEDKKRHDADAEVNNRLVEVVRPTGLEKIPWKKVVMGDIVNVTQNSEFPADLILLASTGDQGMCYIDTCNLDGETNLKIRNSLPATKDMAEPEKIAQLQGVFEYEGPNNRLYTFSGKLVRGNLSDPVDNVNVLLRGSTLRNTQSVFGQVIYTGKESKIMMNGRKGRVKRSNIEVQTNKLLIGILIFELTVVTIGMIGMIVWVPANQDVWYLPYVEGFGGFDYFKGWITYLILLNNYVPISLYVSMEIAKSIQGLQMNWDVEMYHAETDTPALTRTTNLNEELGQIEYIFSDKTGTLTQNVMEFRKCYIGTVSYGFGTTEIGLAAAARGAALGNTAGSSCMEGEKGDPNVAQFHRDPKISFDDTRLLQRYKENHPDSECIRDFMRILSVSHTVVPEGDLMDPHQIIYQAESPDEGALTSFAKAMGWFFCGKTSSHTTVKVHGTEEQYEVLNINKFNSARKRMSVVCRTPEKKLMLYCKGADNVMLERLAPGQASQAGMTSQLGIYATEGLRTLVLAKRELSEEEWESWNKVHHAAATAIDNREEALEKAAEEVEKNMIIAGATAIEDKLQNGVPDAIATLAMASIKIWVLTGDKQETAENIGFACRLLRDDMRINYINGNTAQEVKEQLMQAIENRDSASLGGQAPDNLALLVDGKSLLTILDDAEMTRNLLNFARDCKAVIACRVSPDQKRQIVSMVRYGVSPEPMTLAIGDGANDVPMITEAHVGIGISGNEGLQAVRSADYAIAQFRFLKRLVLVHGRNNYRRVATIVLYSLYKNVVLVTSLFFYNFFNGWSGSTVYESWILSGFNIVYTSVPIICYGFMEQDVKDTTALENPQLYLPGQRRTGFNFTQLGKWVLNGVVHCVLVFFIPTGIFAASGMDDHGVYGTTIMNAMVLGCNLRLVLEENHISWVSHLVVLLSVAGFYMWAAVLESLFAVMGSFDTYSGVLTASLGTPLMWWTVIVTFVAMTAIDVACLYAHRTYYANPTYVIQERERGLAKRVSGMLAEEGTALEQSPMMLQEARSPK